MENTLSINELQHYGIDPSMLCVSDELQHHGIKGQKWGVRRYQNKDGSLTKAGKKHRSLGKTIHDYKVNKKRKKNLEKAREAKKAAAEARQTVEEKRSKLLNSVDAKELYENKHLLTTQELNERLNRIDTEARLQSKIVVEQQKTGMDYVNEKMRSGKNTIDNAVSLYKSVDSVYSTLSSSSMGKALAKKLGLEPKKKEFDADDFLKNINKKSIQEITEATKRLTNEKIMRNTLNDLKNAANAEKTYEEAKKQVDEYNEKWARGDIEEPKSSTYSKKGSDVVDNKVGTGNRNSSVPLLTYTERYETSGKDVVGEGTSTFEGWKSTAPTIDAVYDGEKYVSSLIGIEDKSGK